MDAMTWSYEGFPGDNLKDEVRFILGDTDSTDQLFSDEEIYYLLTYFPNPIASAAFAAEKLATQFARDASTKAVGDLKITLTEKSRSFGAQAARLWILSKQYRGRPQCYAGGISKADRQNQLNNSDRVPPDFYRHMNDLPGTGTSLGSSFGSS